MPIFYFGLTLIHFYKSLQFVCIFHSVLTKMNLRYKEVLLK
jgi:hypothetical protein